MLSSWDVCGPGWDNETSGTHVGAQWLKLVQEDKLHTETSPIPPEHPTSAQGCGGSSRRQI